MKFFLQVMSYLLFLAGVVLAIEFSYILFIEERPRIKLPAVLMKTGLIFLVFYISNHLHPPKTAADGETTSGADPSSAESADASPEVSPETIQKTS